MMFRLSVMCIAVATRQLLSLLTLDPMGAASDPTDVALFSTAMPRDAQVDTRASFPSGEAIERVEGKAADLKTEIRATVQRSLSGILL